MKCQRCGTELRYISDLLANFNDSIVESLSGVEHTDVMCQAARGTLRRTYELDRDIVPKKRKKHQLFIKREKI